MLRLDLAGSSSCQNKQDRARHWRHMSNVKISSDSDRAGSGYARMPSTGSNPEPKHMNPLASVMWSTSRISTRCRKDRASMFRYVRSFSLGIGRASKSMKIIGTDQSMVISNTLQAIRWRAILGHHKIKWSSPSYSWHNDTPAHHENGAGSLFMTIAKCSGI